MEIRQLEHLVAAVETGSLRAAAERTHISQPGLSMSLKRLEDTVGAALLHREPRGVRATAAGEALVRHARIVLSHLRHASGEIEALRGVGAATLRIGVGASFMNRALPCAVARLLETRPGFRLHVVEGVAENQIPALQSGALDLVLVRFPSAPADPELVYEVLHRRALRAFVRAEHPLARRRRVRLADLASLRWIVPDDAPEEIAGPIYRALRRAKANVRPAVQTNSVAFLKRLALASDCVALLPEGAVADEVQDGLLVGLTLPEVDLEDEVGAVYRRDLAELPILGETVALLREELPKAGLTTRPRTRRR